MPYKHSIYSPELALAKLKAATTRCAAAMLHITDHNPELRDEYDWFDDVINQADDALRYLKKRRTHVHTED